MKEKDVCNERPQTANVSAPSVVDSIIQNA